ncbi:MAG: hypothetical protein ACRCTE_11725 [Cellulosilyticaceae bacterium]
MTFDAYVKMISKRFHKHFDIYENQEIEGYFVDLVAKNQMVHGRTFISQVDIVDEYHTHEYCYVKRMDTCSEQELEQFIDFLKDQLNRYKPSKNHMYTQITGVIVTYDQDIAVSKTIRRLKYSKIFKMYLRGWGEVKIVSVNLKTKEIDCSKGAHKQKYVYQIPQVS